MDLASVIEYPKDNDGNFAFPRIAPGTFIGENTLVAGSVWIDLAAVRHGGSIRGDAINPQSIYFSDGPKNYPYSILIGKGCAIDDGVSIHPTEDRNHPCILGKFVLVGHNSVIHGKYIGDLSVAFIGSTTSEATVMGAECLVDAGQTLPIGKKLGDQTLWLVRDEARAVAAETYQLDRAKSSLLTNVREAAGAVIAYSRMWEAEPEGEKYRKSKINLSKLLYTFDALEEVIERNPQINSINPDLIKRLSDNIQILNELKKGNPQEVDKAQVNKDLKTLFNEIKNLSINEGIDVKNSKHRFNVDGSPIDYKYDYVELSNMVHFLKQAAEVGISNLHKINEFGKDSGIAGPWAYYGLDHYNMYHKSSAEAEIDKTPEECVKILSLQANMVRYFVQPQTRLYTDIISLMPETQETKNFIDLMSVLKKIGLGEQIDDINAAGTLIKNSKSIFDDLLRIENGQANYKDAIKKCEEVASNNGRFPPVNGGANDIFTFEQVVQTIKNNFEQNFPALKLGPEILPTNPKNLSELSLKISPARTNGWVTSVA